MKKSILLFGLFLFVSNIYAQYHVYLICEGGESREILSHANGKVSLKNGYCGDGEEFIAQVIYDNGVKKVSLECCGKEKGKYLSHANGRIFLQNGCIGDGELWMFYAKDGKQCIKACGGEKGKYLSHAFGNVQLMGNYGGEGELWMLKIKISR